MSHQALIAKGNENKIHSFLYNTRKQYSQGKNRTKLVKQGFLVAAMCKGCRITRPVLITGGFLFADGPAHYVSNSQAVPQRWAHRGVRSDGRSWLCRGPVSAATLQTRGLFSLFSAELSHSCAFVDITV